MVSISHLILTDIDISCFYKLAQARPMITLESGIDVGQGINVGHGKFVKNNKPRVLNKCRASI